MKKILSIFEFILLIISLIFLALVIVNIGGEGESGTVGAILNWTYALFGIAVIITILFPVIHLATNPKAALRTLGGLGLMVVVLGVAYAMSSDVPIVTPVATFDNPFSLKFTDTQLYATYILLIGAILVVIGGEIRKSFR